jgi:hypothetical protein
MAQHHHPPSPPPPPQMPYPTCNSYAPYCDVICGPSGLTIFFDIISQTACFSEKKVIEHKMAHPSICPSIRMEQLGSQWADFDET